MIPPRRILAAVDFSEPSRTALQFAARLAVHCRAELHVLHAEDPLLSAAARLHGVDLGIETRDELSAFLRASALPSGLTVLEQVTVGPAAAVICEAALRDAIDILVVGARGLSGGERLVFGSTTEGVLRRTQTTVMVVPPRWTAPAADSPDLTGVGPVIVGVDFTAPSLDAAHAAARFARLLGTTTELLHVVPPLAVPERWRLHSERSIARRSEEAQRELAQLARHLGDGAEHEHRVIVGPVAESIANVAGACLQPCPLLVLGRRRPGERGGAPGTTAYRVLTLAQVPVLMYLSED